MMGGLIIMEKLKNGKVADESSQKQAIAIDLSLKAEEKARRCQASLSNRRV
jgi:hypothetical protein